MAVYAVCLCYPHRPFVGRLRVYFSRTKGKMRKWLARELPNQSHPLVVTLSDQEAMCRYFALLALLDDDYVDLDLDLVESNCRCSDSG